LIDHEPYSVIHRSALGALAWREEKPAFDHSSIDASSDLSPLRDAWPRIPTIIRRLVSSELFNLVKNVPIPPEENISDRIYRIIRILYWPLLFPEERVATQSACPVDMYCLKTLGASLSCIRQGLRWRMPSQSQPFAPLRALREISFVFPPAEPDCLSREMILFFDLTGAFNPLPSERAEEQNQHSQQRPLPTRYTICVRFRSKASGDQDKNEKYI
jgi:hypothetical protein